MTTAPAQLLVLYKKDTIATFIRTSYYLNRSNSLSMQFGVLVYNLHVLSKQSLRDRLIFMATSGDGDG